MGELPSGGVLIPVGTKPWNDRERYPLRRAKTTIGRSSRCDVHINDPTVSRVHAELVWVGGDLALAHCSPTNPTLVNGVPVSGTCELKSGDVIEIADGIALRLELFAKNEDDSTVPRGHGQRRIYAILSADAVGYSRLVERDDVGTARLFEAYFAIIERATARANGRVANVTGDGVLALFTSVVSALGGAIEFQQEIAERNAALPADERLEFRVGINTGDVLIRRTGLYGDAVNVAARIQSLASPGGILVSGTVFDQISGGRDFKLEFLRTNQPRNLSREIRIYRVVF